MFLYGILFAVVIAIAVLPSKSDLVKCDEDKCEIVEPYRNLTNAVCQEKLDTFPGDDYRCEAPGLHDY